MRGIMERALVGAVLVAAVGAGCDVEGDITGNTHADPDTEVFGMGTLIGGSGIVILNGLNPASYTSPVVQNNLEDLIGQQLDVTAATKALISQPEGQEFLHYVVQGAQSDGNGVELTNGVTTTKLPGALGMATDWIGPSSLQTGMTLTQLERNGAYWAASLNLMDLGVIVSMIAPWDVFRPARDVRPPGYDFLEAVYVMIDVEAGLPLIGVIASDSYSLDCASGAAFIAQGRCGRRSNPTECGLVVVPGDAERLCHWSGDVPLECYVDGDWHQNPIAVRTPKRFCWE